MTLKKVITRNGVELTYDPKSTVMEMTVPKRAGPQPFFITTPEELERHFDDIWKAWETMTGRKKVYWLLDYTNFTINTSLGEVYGQKLTKTVAMCAVEAVRFNADAMHRTVLRFTNIKYHTPSNLYKDRAEALAVLDGIRSGSIESESLSAE